MTELKTTSIMLTVEQYDRIRKESFDTRKSQSEIIREALEMRWARKKEEKRMKELTFTVEKCLFQDIFDDVTHELANLAEKGQIPEWGSYNTEKIGRSYPVVDYYISLHAGPTEAPGPVVATAYIHIVSNEDTAEVTVIWDAGHKTGRKENEK